MDLYQIARFLILGGLVLLLVGGLVFVAARFGLPLGQLPGDIRIQRDGLSCFFPVATMLLLSIILTIVVNVIGRLFR